MTNKEAQIVIGNIPIKPDVLDYCYSITEYQEAKTMAIKALEQEPCEDTISRQAVLDMMQMKMGGKELYKAVYDMPPVNPQPKTDTLDKIRAEIDRQQKWLLQAGYTTYNVDIALDAIKAAVAESEG